MKKLIYSKEDLDLILTLELEERDKEIERLNNIINELEKYIEESYKYNSKCLSTIFEARAFEDNKILDKLQELKGSDKE